MVSFLFGAIGAIAGIWAGIRICRGRRPRSSRYSSAADGRDRRRRPPQALQGRAGARRRLVRRARRRGVRPARPERRRQVDGRAHARDADAARLRARDRRRRGRRCATRIACAARSATSRRTRASTGRRPAARTSCCRAASTAMAGAPLRARVDELLELVGLRDAADRVARGYSGGMKRRLDIAIGLVHRPRVLFLDEPTTGLDPEARAAMWVEVERLAEQESLTILLTTHYLEEADRLAERVAIVSRGKVVVEGTPEELKANLRGELVTVELGGRERPRRRRRRDRALDRRRERGRRRRTARARARAERRAGDPGRSSRARRPRLPGRVGDDGAAVARRRLPPLHRPRLRDRGRRRATADAAPAPDGLDDRAAAAQPDARADLDRADGRSSR